jgi:hypothetical protein
MRRREPERIYQAHRAAHLARLHDRAMSDEAAEEVVAAWEALADSEGRQRGSSAFWDGIDRWAMERRRRR